MTSIGQGVENSFSCRPTERLDAAFDFLILKARIAKQFRRSRYIKPVVLALKPQVELHFRPVPKVKADAAILPRFVQLSCGIGFQKTRQFGGDLVFTEPRKLQRRSRWSFVISQQRDQPCRKGLLRKMAVLFNVLDNPSRLAAADAAQVGKFAPRDFEFFSQLLQLQAEGVKALFLL